MTADTPLRADAQRNRERLLAAAEEVFLERGAEASMEDVAKRAGVGIGTLYRRFPTRESLFAAVYSGRFLSLAAASHARASTLDTLAALRAYLEELALHTSVYRGLAASLGEVLQSGTPGCDAISTEGQRLLRSAQKTGVVRRDVSFDDLVVVATATSLATEQLGSPRTRIAHLIGLFLDGIATQRTGPASLKKSA
ncbi:MULTISPECIES: TetR/AcrR family transcriptional regulator [Xanthomonas]|uniref:TetR/AcrR family transcriptional regulator n=1 Tax=Xanthomonas TaxID=338 RepID=UPI00141AC3D9|nr:TetR/AcrR family transcriptional regulator [Xanthomonas cannabis]MCC4608770.1 TetR/AcrR family transcriptional regulator [Xanthomonas campestris pv. zinniae]NIK19308.1 AcrR family transcriptional regulator [Xanthomonas cannabis]